MSSNYRTKIEEELYGIRMAIQESSGHYDTTDYKSIVAAVRNGKGDTIPNGLTFGVHHAVYGDMEMVVRRKNVEKAAEDPDRPTLTFQSKYLLSVNGGSSAAAFQYDRPEAFDSVETAIPAGTTCNFNTIAYGGWAAGPYHFVATNAIPAGSKLCINGYQNTALTSLKVQVFANAKATTPSASYDIVAGEVADGENLGTWGTDCNHPQRVSYGSNNEAQSNIFQFLNGDSGNNAMDSIWTPKTDFDMMCTSYTSLKGFLGGFPDDFRDCLAIAEIDNITNNVFESTPYTVNRSYKHTGYFFLPSRKEIYGTNETTNENGEIQFPYYANVATTDADKLMYAKGAVNPATYWLRTPHAGSANIVRICYTGGGGALYSGYAYDSIAVAPLGILA